MKRVLAAIALACAFSVSAVAGDVPTSGFTSAEPTDPTQTTGATSPGEIPSVPGDVPTSGFQQQISDEALTALLSMLGLVI
jgi:hypothetical protein